MTVRAYRATIFLTVLIVVNLIAVCLETIDSLFAAYKPIFVAIELVSVSIFSIEYGLRIWSRPAAPDEYGKTDTGKRLGYIFSFTGIIDLLAILPSILPLLLGGIDLRWLRILRLMRLVKIFTLFVSIRGFIFCSTPRMAIIRCYPIFTDFSYFPIKLVIYVFEHNVQPEHFASIPDAMWWTVITLTTVGYGDIVPMTVAGKLVATITAIMGVCVVALLTGIVATGFTNQVSMRRNQLEAEITSALSDGVISSLEREKIEDLRQRLNISEQDALAIISYLSRESKASISG